MHRLLVAYTTYNETTAKIAERVASAIRHADCAVDLCDLAHSQPERTRVDCNEVISGQPFYGEMHTPQLVVFVPTNRKSWNKL